MTCAKITIANTIDRCDEEPALVTVVVLDELDFGSCIVDLMLLLLFTDKVFFATNCSNESFYHANLQYHYVM